MPFKKIISWLILIISTLFNMAANAEQQALHAFSADSYQQILANSSQRPFMLVVWSIDCSSCLKDMELLSTIHQERPDLKMVMLAADNLEASEQIQQILEQHQLTDIENWVFADENAQKLRFEIDPRWYGELPRTYFFDATHQRTGVSGVLSKQDYETMFAKIMK
jgi:hypothetical protein